MSAKMHYGKRSTTANEKETIQEFKCQLQKNSIILHIFNGGNTAGTYDFFLGVNHTAVYAVFGFGRSEVIFVTQLTSEYSVNGVLSVLRGTVFLEA